MVLSSDQYYQGEIKQLKKKRNTEELRKLFNQCKGMVVSNWRGTRDCTYFLTRSPFEATISKAFCTVWQMDVNAAIFSLKLFPLSCKKTSQNGVFQWVSWQSYKHTYFVFNWPLSFLSLPLHRRRLLRRPLVHLPVAKNNLTTTKCKVTS